MNLEPSIDLTTKYSHVNLKYGHKKEQTTMNNWKIAEAKAKFSQLVEKSKKEPQFISKRDKKKIGVLLNLETFNNLKEAEDNNILEEQLKSLENLNKTNPIDLKISKRRDRNNYMENLADELPD